jgi:hypothetical protein
MTDSFILILKFTCSQLSQAHLVNEESIKIFYKISLVSNMPADYKSLNTLTAPVIA